MRSTGRPAWMVVAVLACGLAAGPARADDGTEPVVPVPADSARVSFFPRGDVFRPLLADPKAEGSYLSYFNGRTRAAFGTHIGSVGIGDQLGIVRWRSAHGGPQLQLSVSGNVFSQFDIGTRPTGLLNADYSLGFPITYRSGRFSSRLRLYHQSSHLGDGVLLEQRVAPQAASYEAVDLVAAMDTGELRAYGGGEYQAEGRRLERHSWVAHWGFELRQRAALVRSGALSGTRLVAGLDVKAFERRRWARSWSGRAGVEIGRARDGGRGWSLLAEYFDGPSPFGQFITHRISYLGMGLHLGL